MESQLKILIIDDSEDDRDAFSRCLRKSVGSAYRVEYASCADSGMRLAQECEFDCIVLDYAMPGRDGISLARELNVEKTGAAVVMLSGQGCEKIAVNAMKSGAQDYVTKTEALEPGRLAEVVRIAIKGKAQEREIIERANKDELTGLYLRAPLLQYLEKSIARATRNGSELGILFY